jgi:N6-L-threonylcarbamoyladenine synthase
MPSFSESLTILGIETSCDDTAAAVLRGSTVLSSIVSSQDEVHSPYGGIVPELASRHHMRNVLPIVDRVGAASLQLDQLDGIAVTCGPGLWDRYWLVSLLNPSNGEEMPLIGVNHLEGHLLAIQIEHVVPFRFVLDRFGGHTSLYGARFGDYILGGTRDDAAGEAFDKAAKMLGLGYPGGRIIDRLAQRVMRPRFGFLVRI